MHDGGREARDAFVLEEYAKYSILGLQVKRIREKLTGGARFPDVLVDESAELLASPLTRDQIGQALASLLVRLAADGVDLPVDMVAAVVSGAVDLPPVPRGGIRWPERQPPTPNG